MYIGENAHSPPQQADNSTWLDGMYIGPQSIIPDSCRNLWRTHLSCWEANFLGHNACSQNLSQTLSAVCHSRVRLSMQEGPVGMTSLLPAFLTLGCPLRMLLSFRSSHDGTTGGAECLMVISA